MQAGDEVTLSASLNDGFDQPEEVSEVDIAFPARGGALTPPWEDIPDEFKDSDNIWTEFVSHWFYRGDPFHAYNVFTRPDVDPEKALRHLRVALGTFETKHEHKIAGVAWLVSRWFAGIEKKPEPVVPPKVKAQQKKEARKR